jgi:hypothetical protein
MLGIPSVAARFAFIGRTRPDRLTYHLPRGRMSPQLRVRGA